MNQKVYQTLKSAETEDWLDYHVVRPVCYYLAVAFNYFDIHPNTVTILSMIVGAGSALLFAHGSYFYEGAAGLAMNIIAVAMLTVADLLDCTDGQLARLSGKKSRMGRILDGMAGFVWFVPIYLAIVWRFYCHHTLEFAWLGIADTPTNTYIATAVVLAMSLVSGFLGMGGQQRLADYYIQVHLFFLKGEKGSEFDDSRRQQQLLYEMPADASFVERQFQRSYVGYTRKQESATPRFQHMMAVMRQRYGSPANCPEDVRRRFHAESLALMPWNGLLTFNFRTTFFFIFTLADVPVLNFVWEIVAMSLLTEYIRRRHERFSQRLADELTSK